MILETLNPKPPAMRIIIQSFYFLLLQLSFSFGRNFSIEIIHPSCHNSFISASNFKDVSIEMYGFSSVQGQLMLRSTLHSDSMYTHSLQWAEGFEWSHMMDLYFSNSQKNIQVRSVPPSSSRISRTDIHSNPDHCDRFLYVFYGNGNKD